MPTLLPDQPPPTAGTGDVWRELIEAAPVSPELRAMMEERRALGIERYGTPLQVDNGRDHLADALQELLDAAVYLWAAGFTDDALLSLTLAEWVRHCRSAEKRSGPDSRVYVTASFTPEEHERIKVAADEADETTFVYLRRVALRQAAAEAREAYRDAHGGLGVPCEGCKAPATCRDSRDVPLCDACYDSLGPASSGCPAKDCEDGYTPDGVCTVCGGLGPDYDPGEP